MKITFDKGTLLAGQPIRPGWYKGSITKVGSEIVGDKVNLKITLNFEDEALKADERYVDHVFYNALGKGIGFLVPYMAAIKNVPIQTLAENLEKGQSVDFEFDDTLNAKIQFKLINDNFGGRLINKIESFLPYASEVSL